jgi:DNA-binding MarR family transcriptional regulator
MSFLNEFMARRLLISIASARSTGHFYLHVNYKKVFVYMASKISPPPRSIGRALNFTTGRMNALCQQHLDPYDLSLPQWVVLSCLWREKEVTVSALANLVGNGLPATSRIVDRMAERGLVARRKHRTDGRAIVVTLTDKGGELRHLSDFHRRINDTLFEGFLPEEQDLAFFLIARMQENAEAALEETKVLPD